jgi:hypothetical protein
VRAGVEAAALTLWSERLAVDEAGSLVWTDGHERVLVHLDSLRVERAGQWVCCDLDVEPGIARRRRVRFAFLEAIDRAGDSILAEAAVYRHTLDERCSNDLQHALNGALASGGTP